MRAVAIAAVLSLMPQLESSRVLCLGVTGAPEQNTLEYTRELATLLTGSMPIRLRELPCTPKSCS
jgi:hypothetical protein